MATIEALRPTADALGIILWEQAVQPTDAPEATLFAQKYMHLVANCVIFHAE